MINYRIINNIICLYKYSKEMAYLLYFKRKINYKDITFNNSSFTFNEK